MSVGQAELEVAGGDRFEVRRRLGTGGMGIVYEAFDRERQELVALKTLKLADANALFLFKNEFRAIHDIDHRNLVSVYELLEVDGACFLTMELVQGVNFLAYVRGVALGACDGGQVRPLADTGLALGVDSAATMRADALSSAAVPVHADEAAPFSCDETRLRATLKQLAQGVAALHAAGRIHRDIKPSNILVTEQGRVVILDFGLVTAAGGERAAAQDGVVGTAEYMAPEQAVSGDVGPEADWYSVGVVLYEALTARLPHAGLNAIDLLMAKQQHTPAPPRARLPSVPLDLDELCVALLHRDPERRPTALRILDWVGVDLASQRSSQRASTSSGFTQQTPFVGREDELAQLRLAFQDSQRDPLLVVVEGESGLGKTALVDEFTRSLRAEAPGVVILAGRCYERDSVAYKAFDGLVDELSRYLSGLSNEQAAELLPPDAGLLSRLFPVLQRVEAIATAPKHDAVVEPQELRRRMFGALRGLLRRISQEHALVLCIDDLQWTDNDSLFLLQEIMGDGLGADAQSHAARPNLMLVVTMRPVDELGRERIFASTNALERRQIDIVEFSRERAQELAAVLLPTLDQDAIRLIADEAAGHPLFVMELARYAEGNADGAGLDDVLWRRISALPREILELLEILCVAGAPIGQETAANAAEMSQAELSKAAAGLRISHLVRTGGVRREDLIEPYHDRVRETVNRHLGDGRRKQCHRRLAIALERSGAANTSPQTLVLHAQAAGDAEGAARYAEAAAAHAVTAMAFDRAAELFQVALRLGAHEPSKALTLRMALADAFANAGRGAEAAETFVRASQDAEPAIRRDCLRQAAEQWLFSGHIDKGLSTIAIALSEVGEPLVATPKRALAAMLWRRMRLRLRGMAWEPRAKSELSGAQRAHLEVVGGAAMGLSMANNIRGAAFNARFLFMALEAGDPTQIVRGLSSEVTHVACQGKIGRAQSLHDRVQAIADDHRSDPHFVGHAAYTQGCIHLFSSSFPAADQCYATAAKQFAQVAGTSCERNIVSTFRIFALRHLGGFRRLGILTGSLCRDAQRRGDLYLETTMRRVGRPLVLLARDSPQEARAELDRSAWPVPESDYHLQEWYELEARSEISLYTGQLASSEDSRRAFARLSRSMLLRMQVLRCVAGSLEARFLLAAGPGAAELRQITRIAARIGRERVGYAEVFAAVLHAAVASQEGHSEAARRYLTRAIEVAAEHGMGAHAAVAKRRLGQLLGGDEGDALVAESDTWMDGEGVLNRARLSALYAPGFDRD